MCACEENGQPSSLRLMQRDLALWSPTLLLSPGSKAARRLVRLRMRIFGSSKKVDSRTMGLQEQNTDKFIVQARGDSDGGHESDKVVD